jgi:hypothetical protein
LKGFLLSVEARWALLWEITWWPYNIFHFKDALVTSCGWSSWVKSRAILENILCYICCHYTIFCKQPKTGGIMWSTNWLYVHQTSLLLTRNTKHVFLALFSPPWYCGAGYRVRFHRCIRYRDFFKCIVSICWFLNFIYCLFKSGIKQVLSVQFLSSGILEKILEFPFKVY